MIDYFEKVQTVCMLSQANPMLMHNTILESVLADTQKYIADAKEHQALMQRVNEIQLTDQEQNIAKSFWLVLQSKLGMNQAQSGQQIGKIDPVKAPFQVTAQGLLFGGGK